MDKLEKQKRLDALSDMFGSDGWIYYEEELIKLRDQLNDIALYDNEHSLWMAKGRLMEINASLSFSDRIKELGNAV